MTGDARTAEPTVVFIHHTKTGGATLRRIINRQYEPEAVATITGKHFRCSTVRPRLDGVDRDRLRVLQGHIPFGVHELLPRPTTYITMLREPIDRIVSLYHYRIEQRREDLFREGRPISLEEFISDRPKEIDNVQTRRLSGLDPDFGECSEAMLRRARDNLRDRFALVGLTERFDQTLVLLRRLFGWRHLLYFRINVTKNRLKQDALSRETLDYLARQNALDLALYREARAAFDALVAGHGADFAAEVETFKRVNAEYARFELYAATRERNPLNGAAPRPEPATLEAQLRAAAFEEHPRLLARQFQLNGQLKRSEYRAGLLGRELEQARAREARLQRELDRSRAREAGLDEKLEAERARRARLAERVAALEAKLAAARERPEQPAAPPR